MALCLGNQKVKLNLNGVAYNLNLPLIFKLLASDNYILTDIDSKYLVYKEDK